MKAASADTYPIRYTSATYRDKYGEVLAHYLATDPEAWIEMKHELAEQGHSTSDDDLNELIRSCGRSHGLWADVRRQTNIPNLRNEHVFSTMHLVTFYSRRNGP